MAQSIFFPQPSMGMVENPFMPPEKGYAQLIRNYLQRRSSMRVRPSAQIEFVLAAQGASEVIWHDEENNQFLWSDGVIRNAAGALVYTGTITSVPYEGTFKDQTYLSFPGQATIRRSATTWGVFPFTLTKLTSSEIAGSVEYRGLPYFWGTDATDGAEVLEYPETLDGITGNTDTFILTRFMKGQTVLCCRVLTAQEGSGLGDVFVIYGNRGRVLVYSGDDPGSNSWFLAGSFQMTAPLSKFSFVEVQGDVLVMGEKYIYSTLALLQGGSRAAEAGAISLPLASLYKGAAREVLDNVATAFGYYDELHNAAIFGMGLASTVMWSDAADFNNTDYRRLQFVYFRDTGVFGLWDVPQMQWPVKPYQDGENRASWFVGRSYIALQDPTAANTEDHVIKYGALAGVNDSFFPETSVTQKYAEVNYDSVWRSCIPAQLQDVRIVAAQPVVRVEEEAIDEFRVGAIADGADFTKDLYEGRFLDESECSDQSVSTFDVTLDLPAGAANVFTSPDCELNLEGGFFHSNLKINGPGDSTAEVFGVHYFYVPGASP